MKRWRLIGLEVERAEVEGCSSRLKGWRLRGRGAEHPHFLEDPKNGS